MHARTAAIWATASRAVHAHNVRLTASAQHQTIVPMATTALLV
jgi:hypothetical protein